MPKATPIETRIKVQKIFHLSVPEAAKLEKLARVKGLSQVGLIRHWLAQEPEPTKESASV